MGDECDVMMCLESKLVLQRFANGTSSELELGSRLWKGCIRQGSERVSVSDVFSNIHSNQ